MRQAQADAGERGELLTAAEREEIKKLRRENFDLRRANEILKSASLFSRASSTQGVKLVHASPRAATARSNGEAPKRLLALALVELGRRRRAAAGASGAVELAHDTILTTPRQAARELTAHVARMFVIAAIGASAPYHVRRSAVQRSS